MDDMDGMVDLVWGIGQEQHEQRGSSMTIIDDGQSGSSYDTDQNRSHSTILEIHCFLAKNTPLCSF
jgi:hypothetical protein